MARLRVAFVITFVFVVLAAIAGNFPILGAATASLVFAIALYAYFKPITTLWLETKPTTVVVMAISVFGIFSSGGKIIEARYEQERIAKEETKKKLQLLRSTDPTAYLAALKAVNDPRWEPELYALNRPEHAALISERLAKAEQNRQQEIEKLLAEAKSSSYDLDASHRIYYRLASLDPANKEYKTKLEAISKLIESRNNERDKLRNPEKYVSIENFSWSKGGFGSIMMANFTIRNNLRRSVKDIKVTCTHSAPSGTEIDSNKRIIFELIEPHKNKRISNFNMGYIHTQAQSSGCKVTRVVVIDAPPAPLAIARPSDRSLIGKRFRLNLPPSKTMVVCFSPALTDDCPEVARGELVVTDLVRGSDGQDYFQIEIPNGANRGYITVDSKLHFSEIGRRPIQEQTNSAPPPPR